MVPSLSMVKMVKRRNLIFIYVDAGRVKLMINSGLLLNPCAVRSPAASQELTALAQCLSEAEARRSVAFQPARAINSPLRKSAAVMAEAPRSDSGRQLPYQKRYVVGTHPEADIQLETNRGVEPAHCEIENQFGEWTIKPFAANRVGIWDPRTCSFISIGGRTSIGESTAIRIGQDTFFFYAPARPVLEGSVFAKRAFALSAGRNEVLRKWEEANQEIDRLPPGKRLKFLDRVHLIGAVELDRETDSIRFKDETTFVQFWGGISVAKPLAEAYVRVMEGQGGRIQISLDLNRLFDEALARWNSLYGQTMCEIHKDHLNGRSRFDAIGVLDPTKEIVTFYHVGDDPHNNEFSASLEEGLFYGGGLEDNCSVPIWAVDVPMSRLEEVMGCVSHFFSGDSEGRLSVLSAKPTVSGFRPDMIRLRREINPYDYGLRYIGIVRQRAVYFGNRLSEDVVVYGSLHELGDEYCNVADYARQNGGHLPSYAQRKGMIPAGTRWNLSIASKVEFQSGAIGKEVLPDGSFSRFLWSI